MNDTLKECPECGAACRVEVFDSHRVQTTIWVCSNNKMFGGDRPHNRAYLYEDAWNARKSPRTDMGDGWQDIASAPEGEMILSHADGMMRLVMRESGQWVQVGATIEAGWYEPTHWRPLPAPPALRTGEATDV